MLSVSETDHPFAPCPQDFNLARYVLEPAHSTPEKPALDIVGDRVWTHGDILNAVSSTAAGLRAQGLEPGARVLLRLGNHVEFPIAFLACIWAGFVPVPTSAQLNRAEISKIAADLEPSTIIVERDVAAPDHPASNLSLAQVRAYQTEYAPCMPVLGDPDRLAYIIYTSGTSGGPRGVCHAHRAIWARRMMWDGWYGLTQNDRVLHAGAFNWSYTLGTGLTDPWSIGATALIMPSGATADDLARTVCDKEVTIFAAAPGVYRQLLKSPELRQSPQLRHALSAGEALPGVIRQDWMAKMGCDIHEALGMSECSTFVSGAPTTPAPTGTSGRAQPGRKIAVLRDGQPVAHDTPGVLGIHSSDPGLMKGYLGDTAPLPEWFETGDIVSMSRDGWITYLGRNDDMITAGGYRISPLEIEAALLMHEGIQECAATAVQFDDATRLIAVFYAGASIDEQDLRAHAQSLLARYKQPRLYIHVPSLPKGANGKLNRAALRRNYKAAR